MASTYTSNLKLEKVTTGEKAGLWGTVTNTNLEILEQAASGYLEVDVAAADVTLVINDGSTGNGKNLYYKLTGTLAGNRQLIMPTTSKRVFVVQDAKDRSSSNYTLTNITSGGSGYEMPVASTALLYSNGTNTHLGLLQKGWVTQTASYTAVDGDQILCDTTSTGFNITLPAGVVGKEITIMDSRNYFNSNNLIVIRNGTDKINGVDGNLTLSTQGQNITLVYANATIGWAFKTNTANL